MKKVIIIICLIIIMLVGYLGYNGLFTSVKIVEKETGPYTVAYKEHKGPYQNTYNVMVEVNKILLNDYKIKSKKGFGLYYDDPKKVKEEDLRSEVGYVLSKEDLAKKDEILKKLKFKEIPAEKCMYAEFPFKSATSIFLGIMKVYPKFDEYMKGKNLKVPYGIEIYDEDAKKIIYMIPIRRQ